MDVILFANGGSNQRLKIIASTGQVVVGDTAAADSTSKMYINGTLYMAGKIINLTDPTSAQDAAVE